MGGVPPLNQLGKLQKDFKIKSGQGIGSGAGGSRRPFSANPKYLQLAGFQRPFSAMVKMGQIKGNKAQESIDDEGDQEDEDYDEEYDDEYVDLNIYEVPEEDQFGNKNQQQ